MAYRPIVPVSPGDPWSSEYQQESQSPVLGLTQTAECSVCGSGKSTPGNEILFCDGPDCDLPVHQKCYGLSEIPAGNWYCQRCEDRIPVYNTPNCCCLRTSGLFKRTTTPNKYIHVACARFNELLDQNGETIFFNPRKMSKAECAICRSSEGVCSPCSFPSCTQMMHVTCAQDRNLIQKSMNPRLLCQQHRNHLRPSESPSTDPGQWTSEDRNPPLFPSLASPTDYTKKKRSRSRQDQRTPSVHGVDDNLTSEFYWQCPVDAMERSKSSRLHSHTISRRRGRREEESNVQSSLLRGRTKDADETDMGMDWCRKSQSPRRRDCNERSFLQDKRAPRTPSTETLLQIQTFDSPKDSESRSSIAKRRCSIQNVGPLSINSNGVSIVVHVQGRTETASDMGLERSPPSSFSQGPTTTMTTTTSTKTTTTQTTTDGNDYEELKGLRRRYDALHNDYGQDKMRNLKMKENLREIFGAFKLPVPVPTIPSTARMDPDSHELCSPITMQQRPRMMEWNPDTLEEYVQALRDVLVTEVTKDRSRPVPDPRKKPQLDIMLQLLHQL